MHINSLELQLKREMYLLTNCLSMENTLCVGKYKRAFVGKYKSI